MFGLRVCNVPGRMNILIVEDEPKVSRFVERELVEQGLGVTLAATRAEARAMLAADSYDAVILDLGLPDGDGLDLLREWRGEGRETPVLILSARDAVSDRIQGLNLGADDYLPKPFSIEELVARLRSILRRKASVDAARPTMLEHRGIKLDLLARKATFEGREVELTNREFALLELFFQNTGRVLTRLSIAEKIWESSYGLETNLIDVYVRRLRQKFEPSRQGGSEEPALFIKTIRGAGYQMV